MFLQGKGKRLLIFSTVLLLCTYVSSQTSACLGLNDLIVPKFGPATSDENLLFPDSPRTTDDRIMLQLSFVPPIKPAKVKRIYMPYTYFSQPSMDWYHGRSSFVNRGCRVTMCTLSMDLVDFDSADIVVLDEHFIYYDNLQHILNSIHHHSTKIWVFMSFERPELERDPYKGLPFNWTLTYSPWSTIPELYGKFYPVTPNITTRQQEKNYAYGKRKLVAWVVSDCRHQARNQYAKELGRHISVDTYGKCGKPIIGCPRVSGGTRTECFKKFVNRYKFYLAFENTNCNTYVTEKLLVSGLTNDVVPVVMGAPKSYVLQLTPPHSFIHVEDFESAKDLADYLHLLDKNDELYNEYFQWKGAWRLLPDGNIWCRLCAMAHTQRTGTVNTHKDWSDSEQCYRKLKKTTLLLTVTLTN